MGSPGSMTANFYYIPFLEADGRACRTIIEQGNAPFEQAFSPPEAKIGQKFTKRLINALACVFSPYDPLPVQDATPFDKISPRVPKIASGS